MHNSLAHRNKIPTLHPEGCRAGELCFEAEVIQYGLDTGDNSRGEWYWGRYCFATSTGASATGAAGAGSSVVCG